MAYYENEKICKAFLAAVVLEAYKDLKLYRKRARTRELTPAEEKEIRKTKEWLLEYSFSFSGIDGSRIIEAIEGET